MDFLYSRLGTLRNPFLGRVVSPVRGPPKLPVSLTPPTSPHQSLRRPRPVQVRTSVTLMKREILPPVTPQTRLHEDYVKTVLRTPLIPLLPVTS